MISPSRGRGVVLVAVAVVALTGCPTPGGPTSPDPVRHVLDGGGAPCRVVFGPVTVDAAVRLEEVGRIDTPDGPTLVRRELVDERERGDLEIDGIDVSLSSTADTVEAAWQLPPIEVGVSTSSLDEDELRSLLPELVRTADASQLASTLAERIPGAEVRYAGAAPGYDVAMTYDDAALAVAGRGVADAQLDAFDAVLERTGAGTVERRADGATVVVGSAREPATTTSEAFAALVEDLMGDEVPRVSLSDGTARTAEPGCEGPNGGTTVTDATVGDVEIVESDVGDLLRVTVDGLPAAGPDPRLVHVTVGDVELVAEHDGGDVVQFPATLSHAEARLLAERLAP
jgi:hypothetical protein